MTSHSASHFTTVRFLVGRFLRAATTDLVIEPCRKSVQQVRQFVGTAYSIASHCLSSIGEVADGVWQVQSVVGETARVLISATAYITTLALYRRCVVGGSTAMQVVLLLALGWAHIVYQLAAWISTRTFALLRVQRYSTLGQMTSTLDWRDIAVLAPDMVPCVGLPYTMPLSVLRAPAAGPDTSGCGSVEDALVDYPFEPHFFYLPNGMRVHYACVELGGDTAGGSASSHSISSGGSHSINSGGSSTASLAHDSTTTLLMVHGRHTWSYLFRNVMAAVAESMDTSTDSISAPPRLRLIALDLPGFGKSDRVAEDARWYHFDESIGSDSAAAALSFARSADTLANDDVDNATTMPMPIFGGTASPLRTEHEKLHQDQLSVRSGSTLFAMDTGMSGAAHGVPASSTLTVMDTSAAIIALHRFTVAEALKRFRPSVVVAHDYGCEVTLDAVHALANWHGGALEANYIPRVLMIEPLVCTGADLRSDNLLASLLKRACASVIPHSFHVAAVEGARKSRAMPMSMASMKTALGACHDAYRQSIAYNGRRSREASAARELDVSLLLDREEPLAILDDVLVRRVVELVPWLEDGCGVIGDVIGWNRRSVC